MLDKMMERAQQEANRLHTAARDGVAVIDGTRYLLTFDREEGHYKATLDGVVVAQFNTRKLATARTWLREHLA